MKIALVSGSHRENSESERIAHYIEKELKSAFGAHTYLLSLANNPLPLWDEELWEPESRWTGLWSPISKELSSSDGLIIVSPEWGGMVPPGLKNFFLLCSGHELSHKPGLIIGVSSGIGGSYPIAELRTSSYKNTHICYIPDHVIVRSSPKMFVGDTPADHHDESTRKRISYSLRMLMEYSKALAPIRSSGVVNFKEFPYGM